MNRIPCPTPEKHTPCPDDYLAWHDWVERMQRTHMQQECPGCSRWVVWVARPTPAEVFGRLNPDALAVLTEELRLAVAAEASVNPWPLATMPAAYTPPPPRGLTEEDVRRIVREEMAAVDAGRADRGEG